jgi:hypothetical protein
LIGAALTSLIIGYYLGQYWQRQPLADLSAVVYPQGLPLDLPAAVSLPETGSPEGSWRVMVAVDSGAPRCRDLLRHFALVRNRLAGWPEIQQRLRLTLLDYAPPSVEQSPIPLDGDWIERLAPGPAVLDELTGSLGILPGRKDWCTPTQANGILVAPDLRRWALLPYEQPAIMAQNIATVVQFVE